MTPAGLQLHEQTEMECFTEARAHLARREEVKPMKMERDWEKWKEGPHAATKAVQQKPCGQRANQDGHVVSLRAMLRRKTDISTNGRGKNRTLTMFAELLHRDRGPENYGKIRRSQSFT